MKIRPINRFAQRITVAILAVSLLVLLSGCGTSSSQSAASANSPASASEQAAIQRGYILIGIPNPSTGPLAGFGQGTPWTEDQALAAINKDGGIFIKSINKKLPVKFKVVDTESNPTKAADVASQLILNDKVNLLIVRHTSDTVNPVSAMAERYGIPCIALDDPAETWLTGGPYKWSYLSFWSVKSVNQQYMAIWNQTGSQTNKTVGVLFPNDSDGTTWSKIFSENLPKNGYKIVNPGTFPDGTTDFSTIISQFKQNNVQIVTGVMIPPDFATFWKQAHQMGFNPKIVTVGKSYLFLTDASALGANMAQGLTGEVWWSPYSPFKSSLTGESAKDLAAAWTSATGQQWTPTLGFKYAGMEIAYNALERAQSLNPEKIREAIGATDMDTIVGHIQYNSQHVAETPLTGGQWTIGKGGALQLQIINDSLAPEIPTTAKMIFPLP